MYHMFNQEMKSTIVERAIQMLKLMVQRTIGVTQNKTYIQAMKVIVEVYNSLTEGLAG